MLPKFKENSASLFIDDKYFCNGHWLVLKNFRESVPISELKDCPKYFKKIQNLKNGTYLNSEFTKMETPNMDIFLKNNENYTKVKNPSYAKIKRDSLEIFAYVYELNSKKYGIAPHYMPLVKLGDVYVNSENTLSPIRILEKNSEKLLALVMPIKLD